MKYTNSSKYKILLAASLLVKVLRGFFCSFFHFKGNHIVAIGKNVTFLGRRKDLTVGKRVKIESGTFIQTVSENGIFLGDNVTICQNVLIRPSGFYGGGAWKRP